MSKIRIHPLYFVLALFYIAIGKGGLFAVFFIVTISHEMAHSMCARRLGYSMAHIALMPYGAVVYKLESIVGKAGAKIGMAGPIFNLLVAIFVVSLWWIIPELYTITQPFFRANLTIALINLLPCYPLDGSRIVIGLSNNKLRAIKITRALSVIVGVIAITLGIASIWYSFNITLAIMGIYLIVSAFIGSESEQYHHITSLNPWNKDYRRGVISARYQLDINATLHQALRLLSAEKIITIVIVSEGIATLDLEEKDLKTLLEGYPLNKTFKEALPRIELTL